MSNPKKVPEVNKKQDNIFEMTLDESEGQINMRAQSADKRESSPLMKQFSSELQILKEKIKVMRDKHLSSQ